VPENRLDLHGLYECWQTLKELREDTKKITEDRYLRDAMNHTLNFISGRIFDIEKKKRAASGQADGKAM
jgi:hypothetical protein